MADGYRWNSTIRVNPDARPPRRRKPVPRVNKKRGGSRFPKRRDPKYCAWIRTLPCTLFIHTSIHVCSGRIECAHIKARGTGGNDRGNVVPLCIRAHRNQHSMGLLSFQDWYNVDLLAIAADLERRYPGMEDGQ